MDEAVCIAGLFHSAYGNTTTDFKLWDKDDREIVRSCIGDRAECLAWEYSKITLPKLVSRLDARCAQRHGDELLHIMIANFLDQQMRRPQSLGNNETKILLAAMPRLRSLATLHLYQALHCTQEGGC
jgi:hypothetical protein